MRLRYGARARAQDNVADMLAYDDASEEDEGAFTPPPTKRKTQPTLSRPTSKRRNKRSTKGPLTKLYDTVNAQHASIQSQIKRDASTSPQPISAMHFQSAVVDRMDVIVKEMRREGPFLSLRVMILEEGEEDALLLVNLQKLDRRMVIGVGARLMVCGPRYEVRLSPERVGMMCSFVVPKS